MMASPLPVIVRFVGIAAALIVCTSCAAPDGSPGVARSATGAMVVSPELPVTTPAPGTARIGIAYPFSLLTHCGIERAVFDGRTWLATTPQPEPSAAYQPGPDGGTRYTGQTPGTMTLVRADLLRFTFTGGSADFDPAPDSAEPTLACA